MHRSLLVAALLLAGCTSPAPIDEPPAPIDEPEDVLFEPTYTNITGTLRSLPGMPGSETGVVEVLPNTGRITATLLWSDPVAELRLRFEADEPGEGHAGGVYDSPGAGRVAADIPEPTPGNWTYTITGDNALDVDWTLVLFVAPDDAVTTVLSESYVLPAGAFFEINTEMPLNATLSWDWSIDQGSDSAFNVHTHFDDEVQYLVEETTEAHAGRVTAERAGGYSLMWENPGAAPQTITYRVWGDFTVDSYFPPR